MVGEWQGGKATSVTESRNQKVGPRDRGPPFHIRVRSHQGLGCWPLPCPAQQVGNVKPSTLPLEDTVPELGASPVGCSCGPLLFSLGLGFLGLFHLHSAFRKVSRGVKKGFLEIHKTFPRSDGFEGSDLLGK